jgi:drug/metabolite transporter (DMT)-like permease
VSDHPPDREPASGGAASALAPRLQVLAAALLFSTGGVAIKAVHLAGWQVACLRSALAAVALLVLLPGARRALRAGVSPGMLLVGATYGTTLVLFVLGNKLTTAANTIFLQSTAPLYVLLLSPWALGERVRRREVAYMAALALGMGLFFLGRRPPDALAPDPFLGNLVAAGAGVTWAATLLGLRALGRRGAGGGRDPGAAAVLLGNLFACAAAAPLALADLEPLARARPADWALLAYLGVVQVALAYVFLTRAFRRLEALEASLLLLVEPIFNPVWTWIGHGEEPGPWGLAGGAVILGATAAKTLWDARAARRRALSSRP